MKGDPSSEKDSRRPAVLVVKPSSLGDIIHTFPAVSLIAEALPGCRIDWLVSPQFVPLVEYHPDVSGIIEFPRKELGNPGKFTRAFSSLIKKIRETRYDTVIDFQGLMRSAIFTKLAKSKRTAGFADPREPLSKIFYKEKYRIPENIIHAVEKNAFLASKVFDSEFRIINTELPVKENIRSALIGKLSQSGVPVTEDELLTGIVPGARWESKKWPEEFFAELIRELARKSAEQSFVIIGSDDDVQTAEKIIAMVPELKIVSMAGKTGIAELVELIRLCNAVITNDSGPMHIAAAMNIPVFAFFGPTDPEKTGPYGNKQRIFKPDINCIKCLKRYCPENTLRCHSTTDPVGISSEIAEVLSIQENKYEQS